MAARQLMLDRLVASRTDNFSVVNEGRLIHCPRSRTPISQRPSVGKANSFVTRRRRRS
jgi:hypothetical protein